MKGCKPYVFLQTNVCKSFANDKTNHFGTYHTLWSLVFSYGPNRPNMRCKISIFLLLTLKKGHQFDIYIPKATDSNILKFGLVFSQQYFYKVVCTWSFKGRKNLNNWSHWELWWIQRKTLVLDFFEIFLSYIFHTSYYIMNHNFAKSLFSKGYTA